ncbi:hypothetical protein, partial [Desulfobaculum sp.]
MVVHTEDSLLRLSFPDFGNSRRPPLLDLDGIRSTFHVLARHTLYFPYFLFNACVSQSEEPVGYVGICLRRDFGLFLVFFLKAFNF